MQRDGSRGVGREGRVQEERLVAEEEGSVAKETARTWGKDRAGQGWSTVRVAGLEERKEVARRVTVRDGCRVRSVHTHSR